MTDWFWMLGAFIFCTVVWGVKAWLTARAERRREYTAARARARQAAEAFLKSDFQRDERRRELLRLQGTIPDDQRRAWRFDHHPPKGRVQ